MSETEPSLSARVQEIERQLVHILRFLEDQVALNKIYKSATGLDARGQYEVEHYRNSSASQPERATE